MCCSGDIDVLLHAIQDQIVAKGAGTSQAVRSRVPCQMRRLERGSQRAGPSNARKSTSTSSGSMPSTWGQAW